MLQLDDAAVQYLNFLGDELKKVSAGETVSFDWLPGAKMFQASLLRPTKVFRDGRMTLTSQRTRAHGTALGEALKSLLEKLEG